MSVLHRIDDQSNNEVYHNKSRDQNEGHEEEPGVGKDIHDRACDSNGPAFQGHDLEQRIGRTTLLIEQGITVRAGRHRLQSSFEAILENRRDEISSRMRGTLLGLYGDWLWVDERIKAISSEIEEISRTEENSANVMTIPGIGPLISTAIVAAIGKGEVFDKGRDFAAWLGLVPRQFSTGGRTILGRISKRGNSYLRMLLVQAANVILMRPHRWDSIGLGPWLRGVVSRMPHNKAAVALANKLARTAWSVLRHGTTYKVTGDEALGAI